MRQFCFLLVCLVYVFDLSRFLLDSFLLYYFRGVSRSSLIKWGSLAQILMLGNLKHSSYLLTFPGVMSID